MEVLDRPRTLPPLRCSYSTSIINIVEYWISMAQDSTQSTILEQGDIFFFYRPKVRSETVESIDDVRRFFVVLAPESKNIFRLLVIGKKSLPEIRKTKARSSERFWAQVGGIFYDSKKLGEDLTAEEFRKGDAARPVGEGKICHNRTSKSHRTSIYTGNATRNW